MTSSRVNASGLRQALLREAPEWAKAHWERFVAEASGQDEAQIRVIAQRYFKADSTLSDEAVAALARGEYVEPAVRIVGT